MLMLYQVSALNAWRIVRKYCINGLLEFTTAFEKTVNLTWSLQAQFNEIILFIA